MKKWNRVQDKIQDKEAIIKRLNIWRLKNDRIVFTNGCFDVLHKGHVQLLAKAADEGNRLIVGLNADASIKRLKGLERPIQGQESRALILASLQFVDAVVIFEEDTPLNLINFLKPDVIVKGGDYTENEIIGAKEVRENGGEVVIVPLVPDESTTSIVEKIKNSVSNGN